MRINRGGNRQARVIVYSVKIDLGSCFRKKTRRSQARQAPDLHASLSLLIVNVSRLCRRLLSSNSGDPAAVRQAPFPNSSAKEDEGGPGPVVPGG